MPLLRKVLLRLMILALLLLALYCYQISDGRRGIISSLQMRNTSSPNLTSASATAAYSTNYLPSTANTLLPNQTNYYNIWCIFSKVASNSPMRRKFQIFVDSLLSLASVDIIFHVISDNDSHDIAEIIIKNVMINTGKFMKVFYYDVHKLAVQLEDIVSVMSPHFSSKPGTYYSDALFFISLGLHRIAPSHQRFAMMFDADTKFRRDVKDLFEEFNNFGKEALFGLAPELTPVYRHVLYLYRNKHPKTIFGEPWHKGGYPGYNSGMVLFNLERLRKSHIYNKIINKDSVDAMTKKYHFKGHLGDQDFYTLLGMERPELIHMVDCGWNRQLCTWWRDRGYADVFANYSECNSETKLWHGNCNTPIPDD
ncbi:xyloside xylosyltransferase 1 [Pogonomyrmex barbatus]|uniref:Xyloside xylosyltransferase 1 n=1 Tax=Pogonomyrmex barbatus TaxID=144034 RepID=A0A6I9XA26_9HYME|nr:xyloside xylosyltransferase 1 [Pogonomyrmex barbatus]XP_011641543.1 xyloside xylosyltransferase 1 [Pogonomyrmex barbatus]XP_025074803.1 xyloside xylosyltransferase 1 [Pogonomyrmex barbatus]